MLDIEYSVIMSDVIKSFDCICWMIPFCSLVCGDALVNTYISIENQIKHTAVFYNLLTNSTVDILKEVSYRVKSGNFGHQVNSDIPLQIGNPDEMAHHEPSHQDFHCLLSLSIFLFQ